LPGLVLPALPALYLALALLIGQTNNDSTLILGLNTFCFENPGSITYTIPSIVIDVSAILVATIHLRPAIPFLFLGGGYSNIFYYYLGGNDEYNGIIFKFPTLSPIY